MKSTITAFLFVLVFTGVVFAQTKPEPNPALKKMLDTLGYKYSTTDLGNFMLDFDLQDEAGNKTGRKQRVFVSSKAEEWGELKVYRLWTTVQKMKSLLSQELANNFLMENSNEKFARWELVKREDGYRLLYVIKVSARESTAGFKQAIQAILWRSDAVENTLTGKDEF